MVEQAVALNPNLAVAWLCRGFVALMCCEPGRAVESFDRMIRLSPLDPLRGRAWNGISLAHFCLGRYDEGIASAMRSVQFLADAHNLGACIANSMAAGHATDAREAAAQLLNLHPGFHASYAQKIFPLRSREMRDRLTAALRDAGLPD